MASDPLSHPEGGSALMLSPTPWPPLSARRRTKVAVMIDRLDGGGAERMATGIAAALDPAEFEVIMVATREPRLAAAAPLLDAGIPVLLLRRRSRVAIWDWLPLWRLLRGERVDVLHTHLHGSNIWGSVIGTLARVPAIVATEHTWSFEGRRLRRLLDRYLVARLATTFVAVSDADRRKMVDLVGVPEGKTEVIPTALIPHAPAARSDGARLRHDLGVPVDASLIGTVARFRPQKALDVVIDAFARIASDDPTTHLILAGDGEQRAALVERIRDLGLEERVHLVGHRRDVPALLEELDVFVLASDYEGSPLALLEAMDAGVPVVATSVGGVPDMVEDGVSGLLVRRRDTQGLADALRRVLADPDLAQRLGEGGRARVERKYGLASIADRWESLYRSLPRRRAESHRLSRIFRRCRRGRGRRR